MNKPRSLSPWEPLFSFVTVQNFSIQTQLSESPCMVSSKALKQLPSHPRYDRRWTLFLSSTVCVSVIVRSRVPWSGGLMRDVRRRGNGSITLEIDNCGPGVQFEGMIVVGSVAVRELDPPP